MAVETQAVAVQGHCDPRFAEVEEEFRRNFAERGELGASVAVTVGGETVVDLWGGWADVERSRPWLEDTLCLMMSCSKGVASLCAHMLAVEGDLDLDAPVAHYWPEFAAAGKEGVLVRHALSHQSGVPVFRAVVEPGVFYDWERVTELLAAEEPWWQPGTAYGYHAFTFGFLVGELVRRVSGIGIGEFVRREIAEPLGLDLWLGLPPSEHPRVSHFNPAPPPAPGEAVPEFLVRAMTQPASLQGLMMGNTGGYFAPEEWDSPAALQAVIPACGGVGNARALADLYRALVHDRRVGRVSFGWADIVRMGAVQSSLGQDLLVLAPGRWTLGFHKGTETPRGVEPRVRCILGEDAFGHTGHGGSIGFCDPAADMSLGYVMNQMDPDLGLSAKGQSLVDAAYRALGFEPGHGAWVRDPWR